MIEFIQRLGVGISVDLEIIVKTFACDIEANN